jgi:sterol desaturase/sphingolipid hydroxylase (fatty acid hydroxylase superfamily)
MDQQSACDAASSDDMQSGLRHDPVGVYALDRAAEQEGSSIKKTLINLIPPATIVVVVLFWMLGPQAWIKNDWSILVAGGLTTAFILSLEFVIERHVGWRLNKREFATDLFYMILGYTAIAWVSNMLAETPLKAIKKSFGITTEWATHMPFLIQVALVIFLIEFGQYWMHRLMHNWTPFWLTHAPHHHITQLNAMKGAVGNPIELFLISLSIVALFDFQQAALFCAFNVLGVVSTFAHANVRSDTRCNYGNSLIVIDRVFGTYREGESAIVGQDERKRLSIVEQFLFPFQPWIDRMKARRSETVSAAS